MSHSKNSLSYQETPVCISMPHTTCSHNNFKDNSALKAEGCHPIALYLQELAIIEVPEQKDNNICGGNHALNMV